MRIPIHLTLAFAVCLGSVLTAQAVAVADPEQVLAEWEKAKAGAEVERRPVLARLGALDDARATAALLEELRRSDGGHAVQVLQALGARPRPEAVGPMSELLQADNSSVIVRRAASAAIAAQGSRGIDLLVGLLGDEPKAGPAVREACLHGLASSQTDRAHRALATLALQGTAQQRLAVLRLLAGVKDVPAVTRARLQLAAESDLLMAAIAVRQLCEEKHARGDDLAATVAERAGSNSQPAVRAELVQGLAALADPVTFPLLLRLAASDAGPVRTASRNAGTAVARDPALVRWLASAGLASVSAAERDAALRLLRQAPVEAMQPLVAKVRERFKAPRREDLALALGLHDLLAQDPTWKVEVLALARSQDPMLRTAGLDLLRELQAPEGLELAQRSVEHNQWEVRSAAYRYLTEVRSIASIPLLIARVDKESGRLQHELVDALFGLTGRRFFDRASWDGWWKGQRDGFRMPELATVRSKGAESGLGTVSYFGIPLVSRRVAFLIDVSGSMSATIGTDRKRTRLDEAKTQLLRVLDSMGENHCCNVIGYETVVGGMWDRLRPALPRAKEELKKAVEGLKPNGGTNIHDALEKAFSDPEVDTIYLLSDGQPSVGAITDPIELADEVRRWNRVRQVVIHGIAIGEDSVLLKRLAAESGGEYRFVR